jgi:glycosyltransferase involved in cell wall biosynthesis
MPKATVVIPWHRNLDDLRRAVASVFDQTEQDFEIVVVVNGADDDGWRQACNLSSDKRYRVERLVRGDVSAARNHGLRIASADLVFFLDADDIFFPDKLATFIRAHAERSFDVAFSRGVRHRGDDVSWPFPIGHWDGRQPISEFFFCDGCTISTSAIVISTSVRGRIAFDGQSYEDPGLVMRAVHMGLDVVMLPDMLYRWSDDRTEHRLSQAVNYEQRLAWIDQTGDASTEKAKAAFRARCVAQHQFPRSFVRNLGHFAHAGWVGAATPREVMLFMLRGLLPPRLRRRLVDAYFLASARPSTRLRENNS